MKMKNQIKFFTAISLFFGLCVAPCLMIDALGAEEATITLSTWTTPRHYVTFTLNKWLEMVAEEGKGKVTIKHFPNAQLYKPTELAKVVPQGTVDMGQILQAHLSGTVKISQVGYLPFLFKDVKHATAFYAHPDVKEILDEAYAKHNVKIVWSSLITAAAVLNNKAPLIALEDFNGLRLSASGPIMGKLVIALGAKPQFVDYTELYMALKRGTLDGCWTPPGSIVARKFFEVQKYMTVCNANFSQFMYTINLKKWNSLSKEVQDILLRTGKKAEEWNIGVVAKYSQAYYNKLKQLKLQIYYLTPEEREVWKARALPIWDEWASEMGPKGRRLIKIVQSIQP